jgi:formylglycine-generating enzyme required for sulfatase activity
MPAQSMPPDDGLVLLQDERKVISLHAGSSPRAADIAFTSIANLDFLRSRRGLLARVLSALEVEPRDVPSPDALRDGFHVRATPSGVTVAFVVTVTYNLETDTLLRLNLGRALSAMGDRLAGKVIWLPLMGTGAGGLSMEDSLQITLETLLAAELPAAGRPVRFCIDLPEELGSVWHKKLQQHAHRLLGVPMPRGEDMLSRQYGMLTPAKRPRASAATRAPTPQSERAAAAARASLIRAPEQKALVELLSGLFDDNGLRRWVRLELGAETSHALPGAPVAFDELCFQLMLQAQQRGLIHGGFFERLIEERPAQRDRIREVGALWRAASDVQRLNPLPSAVTLPPECPQARPLDVDVRTRQLGEQLEEAYARKRVLEAAGASTAEVLQEILRLKRDIRSGGQLRPGDRLGDNRYLLLERVGRGGFANVWKALDQVSGEYVAVKVLHSELASDVIRRERFFRGARIMSELGHPAVVRIIEPHGEDDGYYFFVMELVTGGDLRQAVLDRRVLASDVVPLLLGLGRALEAAHARGFVHRDIKPANVLLTESREPRLTDFDLVAAAETTGGTRTSAMGTFIYAAPEVLDRPQDADARADVYGLGMTAAFVLHGADLTTEIKYAAADFIAQLACDEPLKRILQRAVARKAAERFADAAAFCEALRMHVQPMPRIEPTRQMQEQAAPVPMTESFVEPKTGIRFLLVPGGRFTMGARGLSSTCLPLHDVQVSPFWLAETPVTRRQYEQFLHATNHSTPMLWEDPRFRHPDQPVIWASFMEAYSFCEWASGISGFAIVLPTEAQWEFAARSEDGRPYPWGDEKPDELRAHFGHHWVKGSPLPVGSLPGSRGPFGHLDQAGNVWEWCLDTWVPDAYVQRRGIIRNPIVLTAPDEAMRACRGGGFTSTARELHAAYRNSWHSDRGAQGIGFRVAVLPRPPEDNSEAEKRRAAHGPDGSNAPSS